MADIDVEALQREVARSRDARLRGWKVLQQLRGVLAAAGQAVPEPRERSFVCEGEVLERALKKALYDWDEVLRELATAARWVDRSAFGKEEGFGQAHQALLKALEKASAFV